MSCKDCTQFVPFDANTGLNDVPGDGMCIKFGKDEPGKWIAVCNDHHCLNFQAHKTEYPTLEQRILDKAKTNNPAPPLSIKIPTAGQCKDCACWQRRGFTEVGECWKNKKNYGETQASAGCQDFHASPATSAKPGDIVDIIMGEQMQMVFIGNEVIVCRSRDGKEKAFDKKGIKFRKC